MSSFSNVEKFLNSLVPITPLNPKVTFTISISIDVFPIYNTDDLTKFRETLEDILTKLDSNSKIDIKAPKKIKDGEIAIDKANLTISSSINELDFTDPEGVLFKKLCEYIHAVTNKYNLNIKKYSFNTSTTMQKPAKDTDDIDIDVME